MKGGSKYQLLQDYLRGSNQEQVILSFKEIEALINANLPKSARKQKAWWSNRTKGALQALAWMEVNYRVETVDLEQETITFVQFTDDQEIKYQDGKIVWNPYSIKALRLHMDLTQQGFANELGVRQATVSEWEKGKYEPSRSTSKHLELVAQMVGFAYQEKN